MPTCILLVIFCVNFGDKWHGLFTRRILFVSPNQQCKTSEGYSKHSPKPLCLILSSFTFRLPNWGRHFSFMPAVWGSNSTETVIPFPCHVTLLLPHFTVAVAVRCVLNHSVMCWFCLIRVVLPSGWCSGWTSTNLWIYDVQLLHAGHWPSESFVTISYPYALLICMCGLYIDSC